MTDGARAWLHFVNAKFVPSTNLTDVTRDRVLVLHAILHGLDINVGADLVSNLHKSAWAGNVGLYYPSMISELCLLHGVGVPATEPSLRPQPPINEHTLRAIPPDGADSDSEAEPDADVLDAPASPPAEPAVPLQPGPALTSQPASAEDPLTAMLAQLELLTTHVQGIRTDVNTLASTVGSVGADVTILRSEMDYIRALSHTIDSNVRQVARASAIDETELAALPLSPDAPP